MSPTNLSRRTIMHSVAVLSAIAVLPAIASGAAAHEPDPIFAAIKKYRASDAAFIARCEYENHLEEFGDDYGELRPAPGDYRTPKMVALVTEGIADRVALANTAPTTLAGLVAVLDFAVSESCVRDGELPFDGAEEMNPVIQSLHRGATQIAREAVQS
jgi:hypothetical protein